MDDVTGNLFCCCCCCCSKWCTVLKMLARLFGTRQVKSLENSKDKLLTKKKMEKPRHKEFLTTLTGFGRRREK